MQSRTKIFTPTPTLWPRPLINDRRFSAILAEKMKEKGKKRRSRLCLKVQTSPVLAGLYRNALRSKLASHYSELAVSFRYFLSCYRSKIMIMNSKKGAEAVVSARYITVEPWGGCSSTRSPMPLRLRIPASRPLLSGTQSRGGLPNTCITKWSTLSGRESDACSFPKGKK